MPILPFGASQDLDALVAELDAWRSRLDAKGVLIRSWEGRLRRELEAEAVAASTALEGIGVTADDVRRILARDAPRTVSAEDRQAVVGYRDAMRFVLRRADDATFRWDRGLITNLHDRVLAGSFAEGAGQLRRSETSVIDRATRGVVYEPAPARNLGRLLDAACERLNAWRHHPAIASAWVHVAIAAIHPFRDGNGRTARILSSLAMYRGGFKRPEFCSLEEWWGAHVAEYYAAFRSLGARFDSRADVTPFLLAHVRAQVQQVRTLDARERTEREVWLAIEEVCRERSLPGRLANALWDTFNEREFTPRYYREIADVSRATATNDLAAAVAARLIQPLGERRNRRYRTGPDLHFAVANALNLRGDRRELDRTAIVGLVAQRLVEFARARPGIVQRPRTRGPRARSAPSVG